MQFFKDFWNSDVVPFEDSSKVQVITDVHGRRQSTEYVYIIDLDKYTMSKVGSYGSEAFVYYPGTYVLSIVLLW